MKVLLVNGSPHAQGCTAAALSVVAEALERGIRVVTTDGAPVWEGQPGVTYLKGFRAAPSSVRIRLLHDALAGHMSAIHRRVFR